MKPCIRCGAEKPLDEFYAHKQMSDGRLNACKACVKRDERLRRKNNPAVQAYDRARGSRRTYADTKAHREKYPEAYRARTAVGNALRDGRMKREPCLFCRSTERIHGHHRDYSKPLEVIWLCAQCHHRLHANFPETAAHEPKSC